MQYFFVVKPVSLGRRGRHHHSLCHQVNHIQTSQPEEERVTNATNIKEGPRSFAGQHHLQDQECCQAPPRARCLLDPGYWGGLSVWRGGEKSGHVGAWGHWRRGTVGEGAGSLWRGSFFSSKENLCKLLFALNFTFALISAEGLSAETYYASW